MSVLSAFLACSFGLFLCVFRCGAVHKHVSLLPWPPFADRSVQELGSDPLAWWRRGQTVQVTMATVAERAVVHKEVHASNNEPPAACSSWLAVLVTTSQREWVTLVRKRRKVHVPPDVKESFCSVVRVDRLDIWTVSSLRKKTTPIFLRARTPRHTPQVAHHEDSRLQQKVLWRWSDGRSHEHAHGNSCCRTTRESPLILARALGRRVREGGARYTTKRTLRELCQKKIEWTVASAGIADRSRIINIVETCCEMLPLWLTASSA